MTAGPLARFTVLDLTRVRAGPTAVRYLADWGANCIKVEMPPGAGDADMGGPRHGPDFQNLHRNKRSITLNLKEPDGKAVFMKLVEKADVVVENYRADVKFRLGIDYESLKKVEPAHRAGLDLGLRPGRPLCRARRLRPDRPGHGRPDVGHRHAGRRAGARRHRRGRRGRRPALRHRHPDRAAGARDARARASGCRARCCRRMISMCDFQAARWTHRQDVPGQAGNNHPTSIPTGVFKTKRRLHQHRRVRRPHLQALLREHQGAGADDRRAVLDRQGARQEPRRAECRDRQAGGDLRQRRAGREAQQGRRAGRADLQDGRDVCRSAGQAPQDGPSRELAQARRRSS